MRKINYISPTRFGGLYLEEKMKKLLKLIIGNKKTKRWILLIIIGMLLTCYQFAKIIAVDRLELMELAKIGVLFIIGFTCFILGIVFLQRRILELAVNPEGEEMA